MSNLVISVIIPTLNDPTIAGAVNSVLADAVDDPNVEIIVVGRDDESRVPRHSRVTFVPTVTRPLPGGTRNAGARRATGGALVFLDSDCIVEPGWLAAHRARLATEPCAVGGGVCFATVGFWATGDNVSLFHEFLADLPPRRRRFLPSLNFGIRREVWDAVGGFDPDLRSAEDLDLTARITRAGFPLYFEPRAVARHLGGRRSASAVWRHFHTYGQNSIRVRRRYPDVFGRPLALRSATGLRLGAPLIAAAVTGRMLLAEPAARRYWWTAPVIWLSKLAWCYSAARGLTENVSAAVGRADSVSN